MVEMFDQLCIILLLWSHHPFRTQLGFCIVHLSRNTFRQKPLRRLADYSVTFALFYVKKYFLYWCGWMSLL